MEKEKEKVFRTKTGFCHIFPDRIVLTRDGIVGNLSEITVSNSISRILTIYTLLLVGLLYFAFNAYSSGQTLRAIAFALVSVYLTFGIFNSLNNSANPVIEREKIKSVKFKKAIIGITRSRFEVYFEDVNKRLKKRLIMLPGSMSDGSNETEKALKIFEDEKLITTR
ncbi:MAG: phosphoribosylaminoimidazolesuccinocarboxamide synthase [Cytophagales bacterium]|nr:phosphoribosylaminoimidazolesuccinocarboxamide synthase [Cytophagales bacterium]